MVKARDLGYPADYLVRCQHNRVLPGQGGKLWAAVAQGELLGEVSFEMPRGRGRRARKVTQEIRARRLSLSETGGAAPWRSPVCSRGRWGRRRAARR